MSIPWLSGAISSPSPAGTESGAVETACTPVHISPPSSLVTDPTAPAGSVQFVVSPSQATAAVLPSIPA